MSEQLEIDLLEGVVADAAAIGYRVMSVSGGEPLLYPGLAQLLRAAHTSGLVTTVTTNGMLLDQRQLDVLQADCDLVAISLDGIPESHNFMRNSTRAFDDMCARLPALRASGIPFGFIFTLTFHNVHEQIMPSSRAPPFCSSIRLNRSAEPPAGWANPILTAKRMRRPSARPDVSASCTRASWKCKSISQRFRRCWSIRRASS